MLYAAILSVQILIGVYRCDPQIFFQTQAAVRQLLSQRFADVADVPRLILEPCFAFLTFWIADYKSVFRAVFLYHLASAVLTNEELGLFMSIARPVWCSLCPARAEYFSAASFPSRAT